MTFVEKQMAVHLLSRRDWTWPEIFAFLELVTQKPLEQDERRSLQDRPPPETVKIFHAEQPIVLIAIADTVFDKVLSEMLNPHFQMSDDEYKRNRQAFRDHFEKYAEGMAQQDERFRKLVEENATRARDLLHVECRRVLKEWWGKVGYRV
jgi:hypothetical protein